MIPLSTGAGDCMESMNASSSRAEGQALIASFADVVTEALFHGATNRETRRLPPTILTVAVRKLDMLAAARSLDDLRSPPGNRLEALQIGECRACPFAGFFDTRRRGRPMRARYRVPTHPGEVLLEEFLVPLGISQVALAEHLDISLQRINEIVRGRRGVSPETAWLFAQAFGTTPEFWLTLQSRHDLARSRPRRSVGRIRKAS